VALISKESAALASQPAELCLRNDDAQNKLTSEAERFAMLSLKSASASASASSLRFTTHFVQSSADLNSGTISFPNTAFHCIRA
jgi:hypothetical protein